MADILPDPPLDFKHGPPDNTRDAPDETARDPYRDGWPPAESVLTEAEKRMRQRKDCKPRKLPDPSTNGEAQSVIEPTEEPPGDPDQEPEVEAPDWLDPPDTAAFFGLPGSIVRAIEPASEADPAALLVHTLAAFGNAIGRTAHFSVEADRHHCNEFAVLVGHTSKARKGTSWGHVNRLFIEAEQQWAADRVQTGASSGEGIIHAVRDAITKHECVRERNKEPRYVEVEADPGVEDKRLLVYEPEYANVLKQTERQGNTLSAILRQAWDGKNALQTLTRNSPTKATGAHISMIGHITADELRRYLTQTEQANGFANRKVWVCVRRSKLLPEGGQTDPAAWEAVRGALVEALAFARQVGEMKRDEEARAVWHEVYGPLSDGKPGLTGALLARGVGPRHAAGHAVRLAGPLPPDPHRPPDGGAGVVGLLRALCQVRLRRLAGRPRS